MQLLDDNAGIVTGDIILFSGRHPLHRRQQERTNCPWAQVGLLLRLPGQSGVFVFESTRISECRDVFLGRVVHGVQLVRLAERVGSLPGDVAIRTVRPPLGGLRESRLIEFAMAVHGRPFNDNRWEAGRAFYRRNRSSGGAGYFCSELVAAAYQRVGLLPPPPGGMSANNYIPADFSSAYPRAMLPLTPGFELGPERLLE
jgi:hypothetical protein